jgi:hypothetical protein
MVLNRSILVGGCAAALLLAAPQSRANTIIDVASAGISSASLAGIEINYTGPGGPVSIPDVYAGVINLNLSASSPFDPGQTLGVFCTDIFTDLVLSGGYFVAEGTIEDGKGVALSAPIQSDIGWLINNYETPNADTLALEGEGMTPDEFAAATQVAIWQTEYGAADFTFDSYSDTSLNYVSALDPGWVSDLESLIGTFGGTVDEWEPSDSSGNPNPELNQGQSFVGGGVITNQEPVPEPASMALLSVAVAGLAAVRRRKRG